MPNAKNGGRLISNSERTPSEVKANTSKGGKASGEARRKKKERRGIFRDVLEGKYDVKGGGEMTGEELLIHGIAVNLSDPRSKNWLGTAKMVVEAMGYGMSPQMKEKLDAEVDRLKAEAELARARVETIRAGESVAQELPEDPLSASLREEAERMDAES